MRKKVLRWAICVFSAVTILIIIGILLIDTIVKSVAQRRVRAETGMETKIGKFTVELKTSTIHIENFVLKNPAEFGESTFVEMPELHVQYDRDSLRAGKLRFKLVRINLAQIHVVENEHGQRNVDELQKHSAKSKSSKKSRNEKESPFAFDGIDVLNVTLRTTKFTSLRDPGKNMVTDLSIKNETFKDLKTEKDFQTVAAVLAIKTGASFLLSGGLPNPIKLFKQSSNAGTETKTILEHLTGPTATKSQNTNLPDEQP